MIRAILRNILLIGILFSSSQLFGQNTEEFLRTDVVYLKNGSIFRGQIESYEIHKELRLRLDATKVMVFDAKNIKKIIQEATEAEKSEVPIEIIKPYAFKEKGIYFVSHIGYLGGNSIFGDYTNAFNVHTQVGFQFNRLVGSGIGAGVDFYNVNLGSIIPVYGTVRGYLKEANVSPYYQVAAGYGWPMENENSFFTDSKGGYYVAPELGFRFGSSAETNLLVGIGLQWQKARYLQDFGDGVSGNEDDYTFRRFNFKIGILF